MSFLISAIALAGLSPLWAGRGRALSSPRQPCPSRLGFRCMPVLKAAGPASTIVSPRSPVGETVFLAVAAAHAPLLPFPERWADEPGGKLKAPTTRDYETVGYVISGSARLDLEGQTLDLRAADSWLVPAGAMHQYTIIQPFTALEATAPPAEVHGRDAAA